MTHYKDLQNKYKILEKENAELKYIFDEVEKTCKSDK